MKKIEDARLTEERLYQEYIEGGRGADSISKEIGCDKSVVLNRLRKYGIPVRPSRIVSEKLDSEEWLRREFIGAGRSAQSIAEEIGCSTRVVYTRLKEYKISKRSKWTNETFFDELDPDGAYVLGFIIADGHIPSRGNSFVISQKDEAILDKFSKVMGGGRKVKNLTVSSLHFVGCSRAVEVLTQKYAIPRGNKSLTVRLPNLENRDLVRHLIRGVFDGDGSVAYNGNEFRFFSGSRGLLEDVAGVLEEAGIVGWRIRRTAPKRVREGGKKTSSYWLGYSSVMTSIDFGEFIYGKDFEVWGSSLFLERKRKRFIGVKERWRGRAWIYKQVEAGVSCGDMAKRLGILPHQMSRVARRIGVIV